jgi:hypothetical protein
MGGQILPAQLKLTAAIAQQRISDVRGWLGPPGSKERVPDDLFSDSEFTMIVTPHGRLTIHPSYKRHKFEEKHKIDLDKWWREIDFDQDEGKQAFPAPLAPCQELPDQPHLLLPSVLPARNGETEAPAQPPALEADAAPTPDAGAGPKVLRAEWLDRYLTEKRQADLTTRHNTVTSATKEIHELMKGDPIVEAYAHARNIERHPIVRRLFPPSRPSKKKKG